MSNYEFAIRYLKAVEKTHPDYFAANGINILDCVEIKGECTLSVHIVNEGMPFIIKHEIEMMFWVS